MTQQVIDPELESDFRIAAIGPSTSTTGPKATSNAKRLQPLIESPGIVKELGIALRSIGASVTQSLKDPKAPLAPATVEIELSAGLEVSDKGLASWLIGATGSGALKITMKWNTHKNVGTE